VRDLLRTEFRVEVAHKHAGEAAAAKSFTNCNCYQRRESRSCSVAKSRIWYKEHIAT
jgi:hypothetical protein